jgi:hypothetical protein
VFAFGSGRALPAKKFRAQNRTYERNFGMLNHLQTQRQLMFDLTANYLEPLRDVFSRLAYIAGLRNTSVGKYLHDKLATIYAPGQIDQVLAKCHEELFERLLEMSLSAQEEDFRKYLKSLPGPFDENARTHKTKAMEWIPPDAPSYLKELFRSNLNVLTEILLDKKSTVR